eukprot:3995783-Pyramimonas_sp.AAC.1
MPCAEWYTSVDSGRLSTVELKSKAFLDVDSGAWTLLTPRQPTLPHVHYYLFTLKNVERNWA